MNWLQLLPPVIMILVLYLIFTVLVAMSYHDYLRRPYRKMSRIFFVFTLVTLVVITLYITIPWLFILLILLQIILSMASFFSIIIIISIALMHALGAYCYYKRVTRCNKVERRRVGSLELAVCVMDLLTHGLMEET